MLRRHLDTLLPIVVITAISFGVAWGLFKLLESTATVNRGWFQLSGGAAGFVVVFWRLWNMYERQYERQMKNLADTLRSEDLAIEIARLSAYNVVKEGEDDIAALNTAYSDTKYYLSENFSRQNKSWLNKLLKELRSQTKRQAREKYPQLRDWEPEEAGLEVVVEES